MQVSKRLCILKSKKGNANIEAALVIPLLVIIIAMIMKMAVVLEIRVDESSREHYADAKEVLKDTLTNTEDFMRGRWTLK